jgi:hypothetical protein
MSATFGTDLTEYLASVPADTNIIARGLSGKSRAPSTNTARESSLIDWPRPRGQSRVLSTALDTIGSAASSPQAHTTADLVNFHSDFALQPLTLPQSTSSVLTDRQAPASCGTNSTGVLISALSGLYTSGIDRIRQAVTGSSNQSSMSISYPITQDSQEATAIANYRRRHQAEGTKSTSAVVALSTWCSSYFSKAASVVTGRYLHARSRSALAFFRPKCMGSKFSTDSNHGPVSTLRRRHTRSTNSSIRERAGSTAVTRNATGPPGWI